MTTSATPFDAHFGSLTGPGVRLTVGRASADVLPFLGFNCVRWDVGEDAILFAEPADTPNASPTRSGHPILFPFPNRIRAGRFTFAGHDYELPLNDSTKANAIHGFTPRNPWRVVQPGIEDGYAYVVGEFHLTRDLPDAANQWPTDFVIRIAYRLYHDMLRVDVEVKNPTRAPLPFGLGYHPYFRPPDLGNRPIDAAILETRTARLWESDAGLPTGRVVEAPAGLNFTSARPIGTTAFDHVFTDIPMQTPGLRPFATLAAPGSPRRLAVHADASFRELVLFTPTHRKALAIEPYTCATDAVNLESKGVVAGWRTLAAGGRFTATVEYRLEHNS
jgi:aldose 1-epimerase